MKELMNNRLVNINNTSYTVTVNVSGNYYDDFEELELSIDVKPELKPSDTLLLMFEIEKEWIQKQKQFLDNDRMFPSNFLPPVNSNRTKLTNKNNKYDIDDFDEIESAPTYDEALFEGMRIQETCPWLDPILY